MFHKGNFVPISIFHDFTDALGATVINGNFPKTLFTHSGDANNSLQRANV